MVDTARLNDAINEAGIKRAKLASSMGISRQSLANKINNRTEFRSEEAMYLMHTLGLNPEAFVAIFFVKKYDSESYWRA